ncbi:carbohydrate ABC transporter permease [Candidatus Amarobacter glycogenicus]|uniref:carbohydrate ABC transporter permease n=1 Tax=Candidatus Amarobacter glycogenicus TaxID=3140699 RepID=UPI003135999C|nr:carbohydrate ABC transporter permease [Dehalococcoidia bacterium]
MTVINRQPLPAGAARSRRMPWQSWLGLAVQYALVAGVVLLICAPLFWMLTASVKTRQEIYTLPISWLPETYAWENFRQAWTAVPFERYFVNSIVTTSLGSLLKVTNGVLAAYALVFLDFPKKNLIFLGILAALMVPEQVTLIPNYVLVSELGWVNSYQGIIIPGGGVAFGTFLMRQHFLTLPREVIEAARMDGAGNLRMLWSVVLPMSRPTLVAFVLITVVEKWNDYVWPLLIATDDTVRTLPLGLQQLQNSEGQTQWGVVMAGAVLVIVPVLGLFVWAQRHIVEGLTAGSVKG